MGAPPSLSTTDYETPEYEKDANEGTNCDADFGGKGEGTRRWGIVCGDGIVCGVGDVHKRTLEESAI